MNIGDEVQCNYTKCEGKVFIVARIHESNNCASKKLIVAHLKGDESREIKGNIIDGVNYGIDSSWFSLKIS